MTTKEWAFLACIAQPADFSDAGTQDVKDLCDEGASDEVYVAVDRDTMGDHHGAIRYEILKRGEGRRVVGRRAEQTGSNPSAIVKFAEWAISAFPANHRLMVIWGHGFGFRPFGENDLKMPVLQKALRDGMDRAGLAGQKLTILGFDSCLMNTIEVTYELRREAAIIVGSQQTEPYEGWPYAGVLKAMKSVAEAQPEDATELASRIVGAYIEDHTRALRTNVTQSALLTERVEACVEALGQLGLVLKNRLPNARPELQRMASGLLNFRGDDYADLGHLARRLQNSGNATTRDAAKAVSAAVSKVVIANERYFVQQAADLTNANGLSVWFPQTGSQFQQFRTMYEGLAIARDHGGWLDFLEAYHAE